MKKINIFCITLAFLALGVENTKAIFWYVGYPYADDITATLKGNTLTFSGLGNMKDFSGMQPYINYRDSIKSVVIENGITSVGANAFSLFFSLKTVSLSNTVSKIGDAAFADCTVLSTISIPNSVLLLGDYSFAGCTALTSLNIGNYLTGIGEGAFKQCYSLTSVKIPSSVITIKDMAFSDCTGLTDVYVSWTIPPNIEGLDVFFNINVSQVKLHIPQGTLTTYQTAPVWKNFNIVEDITSVDNIYAKTLKLYPNPVKDELFIDNLPLNNFPFTIFDLSGKIVNSQWLSGKSINVSSLPSGVYVVKIGKYRGKFVKE